MFLSAQRFLGRFGQVMQSIFAGIFFFLLILSDILDAPRGPIFNPLRPAYFLKPG